MRYDFLIIGSSGMQGRIVARDLWERGHRIALADLYREGSARLLARDRRIPFERIDLRKGDEAASLIGRMNAPIVVNCAEGDWNAEVYRACLAAKRHVIDLGSDIPMTREQLAMGTAFRRVGCTAITGCGSTPGINNVMLRAIADRLDRMHTVEAGFAWNAYPKRFVVPFSIESIIEEFTEPAPAIEDGEWVYHTPLETIITKRLREIGSQRCFIVRHPETLTFFQAYKRNGLRNLRFYAGFPRYCIDVIQMLIALKLGSKEPIEFEGRAIRPVEALARMLQRVEQPPDYRETEVLWVAVAGVRGRRPVRMRMECVVPTLPGWEDAGCNIDTGFPAAIIARMIADQRIRERGSFAPEQVVPTTELFRELALCGMTFYEDGVPLAFPGVPPRRPVSRRAKRVHHQRRRR